MALLLQLLTDSLVNGALFALLALGFGLVSPRFSVNDLKGRLITLQERRQLGWVLEFVWARTDADWQPGAGGAERVVG